mmetsp:Transcript_125848/g.361904  ORF Transcript_125848/g.361904 Transcript_125848/m.361904 type:complete len:215 (-) Transcript_125848:120-764(-)
MDIKPMNIVRALGEGGREDGARVEWKLIDLDGALPASDEIHTGSNKFCFTPLYMPPELARTVLDIKATIKASRLMDVWSVGMCVMQAIFGMPALQPWYDEWLDDTGSEVKFLAWLGDYDTEPIVHGDMERHLRSIEPRLNTLLKKMLRKDPDQRFCSARCLMHNAFREHHRRLLSTDAALQEWMEARKCDLSATEDCSDQTTRTPPRSSACSLM